MCRCSGDDVNPLLLHCKVATNLWSVVLRWCGVQWLMSGTVMEALQSWAKVTEKNPKGIKCRTTSHYVGYMEREK